MIRFRPHHFLCTLGFEGKGYSEDFVRNFGEIARALRETGDRGDATPIAVVDETDSICAPCPNRAGTLCSTEAKIRSLDSSHAEVLGLKSGDQITWAEAKQRLRDRMTVEKHHQACAPCAWKAMGVCEAALRKLKSDETKTLAQTDHHRRDGSRSPAATAASQGRH